MSNTNTLIIIVIVVVVVLGAFWLLGGGLSITPPTPGSGAVPAEEEVAVGVDPVQIASNEALGEYLTDSRGMTLYTTTKESCTGDCLTVWPLYGADAMMEGDGAPGSELRGDTGGYQYTWNGEALYFYAQDQVPGEANGDGLGGVWSVARP